MAKKTKDQDSGRKSGGSSLGKGLMLIILLWLAGLTAFAWMNRPSENSLEPRVAKLEKRTATVGGKIPKPGSEKNSASTASAQQMDALEGRLETLEKKLAAVSAAEISGSSSKGTPGGEKSPAAAGGSPWEEMKNRVDELEARLLACGACSESPAQSSASASAAGTGIKEKTETKAAPKKAAARLPRKKSKPAKVARRAPAPAKTGSRGSSPKKAAAVGSYEHYDSLYEISMRMGPQYGYTDRDAMRFSRMAPGAAVHPTSNPTRQSSLSGSSTYYNRGILE
jgi:hypothetical protein